MQTQEKNEVVPQTETLNPSSVSSSERMDALAERWERRADESEAKAKNFPTFGIVLEGDAFLIRYMAKELRAEMESASIENSAELFGI
jgi:hypothetical protein